jgi:Peptidase family M1 domain/Peptidase M1 N-terminal domain
MMFRRFFLACSLAFTFALIAPVQAAFEPKNRPYDVEHYRIEIHLDAATGKYESLTMIRFKPTTSLNMIALDADGIKVTGAKFGGVSLVVTADLKEVRVQFPQTLMAGQQTEITLTSEAVAKPGTSGLIQEIDPRRPSRLPLYYSDFEAAEASKVFPCNDEPADKATSETIVTVDPRYDFYSNGRLMENALVQVEGKKLRRVHWILDKPHSTYLITLVFGQFDSLRSKSTSLPMAIHVGPGSAPRAQFALDTTEKAMKFFEQFYGVSYPWPKYDQIGIPNFGGGMENTTQTTMRESVLTPEENSLLSRFNTQSLVAHELNHQWFGDYVTLQWWDDLWLNEGVTTFMADLAYSDYWGQERGAIHAILPTWLNYYRQEEGPRAHPIVSKALPSPDDLFDATSYTKAARVMHMLDTLIGRAAFRQGMRSFLKTYAYSSVTSEQFFAEMEKASGKDLKLFRDGWLRQRGYPVLTINRSWDANRLEVTLAITGHSNHPEDTSRFILPLPIVAHRRSLPTYDIPVLLNIDTASSPVLRFKLPAEPEWITWNDSVVALAEIETPNIPEREWIAQALKDPNPVSRLAALRHLAAPLLDRKSLLVEPLSVNAKNAISRVISQDSSAPVRSAALRLLADSPNAELPEEWGAAVLEQATDPRNLVLNTLERLDIQATALNCLGKFDTPEVATFLRSRLLDPKLPFDLLGPTLGGWARLGDKSDLAVLKQALAIHGKRGYSYERLIRPVFALAPNEEALPLLQETLDKADLPFDIAFRIVRNLAVNEQLKQTEALAQFVQLFVLTPSRYDGDLRARMIGVLEEAKTPFAQAALEQIVKGTTNTRIRELAQLQLAKNFPPTSGKGGTTAP